LRLLSVDNRQQRANIGSRHSMSGIDPNNRTAPSSPKVGRLAASGGDDYEFAQRLTQLPAYARSLLRIEVPVVVTLATTRQPVSRVLDLAPGTILHFAKSCDEPLTLSVSDCDVAVGETVKVGEKFGLRLTSMLMPQEKFERVHPSARS
jgi:flagellar motor switch protein FliN/FliY